ncbi:MAG: hypothetical protein ACIAQZ_15035 [Sedimentisphaeraceae bacterium JB056]
MGKIIQKLFDGLSLKYIVKIAMIVTFAVLLTELLYIGAAYSFGARCVGNVLYELFFGSFCLFFKFYGLLFCLGFILLIVFMFIQDRKTTVKWFIILVVSAVEFYALECLVEPVQFFCVKGFANHASQRVDIEMVQSWLASKKIAPGVEVADFIASGPEELYGLNSRFLTLYSYNGKRALMASYGSSLTGVLFGFVVTGENGAPIITKDTYPPGWKIKEVNECLYLWNGRKYDAPPIAELFGIEPVAYID